MGDFQPSSQVRWKAVEMVGKTKSTTAGVLGHRRGMRSSGQERVRAKEGKGHYWWSSKLPGSLHLLLSHTSWVSMMIKIIDTQSEWEGATVARISRFFFVGYCSQFTEKIPTFLDYAATQNKVRSFSSYFKKQMPTIKYIIATTTT